MVKYIWIYCRRRVLIQHCKFCTIAHLSMSTIYDSFDYAGLFQLNRGSHVPVDLINKYVLHVIRSWGGANYAPRLTCYHGSPGTGQLQERRVLYNINIRAGAGGLVQWLERES